MREAYLSHRLEAATRYTHVNAGRLAAELRAVRDEGYATTAEEVREGSCSIAVPVRLEPHPAAIGLVMPSTRQAQMTRHLPTLRGIARRIEAAAVRPQPSLVRVTRSRRRRRVAALTRFRLTEAPVDPGCVRGHDEAVVTRRHPHPRRRDDVDPQPDRGRPGLPGPPRRPGLPALLDGRPVPVVRRAARRGAR